jgi:hypothetical protein
VGEQRPHFLIVCDHGIRGDHGHCDHSTGCKEVDRVALLPWFPDRGWWAAEGIDQAAIGIWPMEGDKPDKPGWNPKWIENPYPAPGDDDPRRFHIEISCPQKRCRTWAHRGDDDKLQTLLTKIADDETFRAAVTMFADDKLIVIKLEALRLAKKYAKTRYGLQV